MGFVFLVRLVQFLFLFIALLESMFASKLAGNMIHLSLTSQSKSKFSVIPYVSCFLEIIQRFSIFVIYESMVADGVQYRMKLLLFLRGLVFKGIFLF